MEKAVQPHIPGLARSDKKPSLSNRTESVLQAHVRDALARSLGYPSMEAGNGRKKVRCTCTNCGHVNEFTPGQWQGNTVGFPDLAFFRWDNFPAVGMFIELKGAKTPVRPAQQQLADAGRSIICRSEEEVIRAVLATELAMSAYQMPDARRELIERFLKTNAGRLG